MKKILIISFTDQKTDPRVNRQIRFFKAKHEVFTAGIKGAEVKGVVFYQIERIPSTLFNTMKKCFLCKMRMFEKIYWGTYKFKNCIDKLSGKNFDLILSNDVESLPFALRIAKDSKVILDAHEYTPREFEDRFVWRFFLKEYKEYLCRKYLILCDRMITVSDGIANEYKKNFNIKPEVVTNACDYVALDPSPVDNWRITLIHHGVTIYSRKLEVMIDMMKYVDKRFTLYFMLVNTDSSYLKRLKKLSEGSGNIRFREPVNREEIVKTINQYDIGIFILPLTNINYKYALPNKLFEFVQARLAVAIGPSPEMSKIVKQYDLGIVAEDFRPETIANELNKLTREKIEYYKQQSDNAAYELSSEGNYQKLENLITELSN